MVDNIIPEMDWAFVKEAQCFDVPSFPSSSSKSNAEKLYLKKEFPDPEGVLDTAYNSILRYTKAAGLSEDTHGYELRTTQSKTSCFEEYTLQLKPHFCIISASDPEGIRRGIYEFIDQFCANGGCFSFKEETINRKPWLNTRLGRCPFSPIKRWPVNTDELLDEIDYYPDAYLETLARDGINGIWLVSVLRELGVSRFTHEDPHRKKRLAKLSKVASKCAKYGIKVWLFMIEPFALPPEDILYREHPELFIKDASSIGRCFFCPASPATSEYLQEILSSIFSEIPILGGVINITHGERGTTCVSLAQGYEEKSLPCQDQCHLKHGEILRNVIQAMYNGIKAGSPSAELISWFYMPYPQQLSAWGKSLAEYVPDNVVAQFNFESGGEKEQLGKVRIAGDYWVSYDGPAQRFADAAKLRRGKPLSAKLQLGCGHELTVVPYIPVPDIAYNKYEAMHRLGVNHVMQSWYIGNFPGLMERATGRLAFEDFSGSRENFMLRLAAPEWGMYSPVLVKVWKIFAEAYHKFPFALMFQYYAPQNAFMMWKFHFLPDLAPLAPPWKPNFAFGGDTVGEALAGFELSEVIILLNEMTEDWKKGLALLEPLKKVFSGSCDRIRDLNIAELLGLIFEGTRNLLVFYSLRRQLYTSNENSLSLLGDMISIVHSQKELYKKCIPLLEQDSRLGFHGEALTRIFDEDKTRQALADADHSLLEAEALRQTIQQGNTPFEYAARKILQFAEPETLHKNERCCWSYRIREQHFHLNLAVHDLDAFQAWIYFTDLTGTRFPLIEHVVVKSGKCNTLGNNQSIVTGVEYDSGFHLQYEDGTMLMSWPLEKLPGSPEKYLRFNFYIDAGKNSFFARGTQDTTRLLLYFFAPDQTYTLPVAGEH